MWLRRFNFWKVGLWFGLGALLGWAIPWALPEAGPGNAKRLPAETFVTAVLAPDPKGAGVVSDLVLYPEREGISFAKFGFVDSDGASERYVLAGSTLTTKGKLQQLLRGAKNDPDEAAWAVGLEKAIAGLGEKRSEWGSLEGFLAEARGVRVERAWWAEARWRNGVAVSGGMLVVGVLGSLAMARRSAEEQAAKEYMKGSVSEAEAPKPQAAPSAADLSKVAELDALLMKRLQEGQAAVGTQPEEVKVQQQNETPMVLAGGKLEAIVDTGPKEDKEYAGEYYPTVKRGKKGFTLVELIVVIGILGVVISLIMPSLIRARQSADTIQCAANLRSIGIGMQDYLTKYQNTFPAAYLYKGHKIEGGTQSPTSPSAGYIHWSSFLYGSQKNPAAFTCPAMNRGGLPPTNTPPDNRNDGQVCPGDSLAQQLNPPVQRQQSGSQADPGPQQAATPAWVVDEQAPRLAFTVNEVLCPRNKFAPPLSADRRYRYVKANEVRDATGTILATEMLDNSDMISYGEGGGWCMSHRPIHGFVGTDAGLNMFYVPLKIGFRKCTKADLDAMPGEEHNTSSRLDLVGRNHGARRGYPDKRLSNFLYVDGHVETKSVYDTLTPWQWGEKFYSLVPNGDLQADGAASAGGT